MTETAEAVGKVRSEAEERALDEKIERIQRKNREIEERQKVGRCWIAQPFQIVRDEAKQAMPVRAAAQRPKAEIVEEKENTKITKSKPNGRREWDSGKTPAEQWKMNVPEVGDRNKVRNGGGRWKGTTATRKPAANGGDGHDNRFRDPAKEAQENAEAAEKPKTERRQRNRRNITQRSPNAENGVQNEETKSTRRPNRQRRPKVPKPIDTENAEKPNAEANPPKQPSQNRKPKVEGKADEEKPTERQRNNRPKRPAPDHIQVRQIVRRLVGRVVAAERRTEKPQNRERRPKTANRRPKAEQNEDQQPEKPTEPKEEENSEKPKEEIQISELKISEPATESNSTEQKESAL